eukprot:638235_1
MIFSLLPWLTLIQIFFEERVHYCNPRIYNNHIIFNNKEKMNVLIVIPIFRATGLFKECVFTDNNITQTEEYASTVPLITVASSQITFIGCVFAHNYLWRPWITIATKS